MSGVGAIPGAVRHLSGSLLLLRHPDPAPISSSRVYHPDPKPSLWFAGLADEHLQERQQLLLLAALVARDAQGHCQLDTLDVAGRQALLTMQACTVELRV